MSYKKYPSEAIKVRERMVFFVFIFLILFLDYKKYRIESQMIFLSDEELSIVVVNLSYFCNSFLLAFIKEIVLYKGIHKVDFCNFFDPPIYIV